MPIPLLAALGAAAATAAVGVTGRIVGEVVHHRTRQKADKAAADISDIHRRFILSRQRYIERLRSYGVMINAAIGSGSLDVPLVDEELPADMKIVWEHIKRQADYMSFSVSMNDFVGMSPKEKDFIRKAALGTHNRPEAGPYVLLMMAGIIAKNGVGDAISSIKDSGNAHADIQSALRQANKALDTLGSQVDQLSNQWDLVISPNLKRALGPPRDEQMIDVLRSMASGFLAKADELMGQAHD